MNKKMVPMYLTFFRIALVLPIILLILHGSACSYWLAAILWLIAGLTDGLDGYISRKWSAQTTAGALLDPVADKILTLSILILLCYLQKIDPYLVILLASRDIYITGLRSIAAEKGLILYAKPLAKWKTTLQIVGIFLMLIGTQTHDYVEQAGYGLLWFCVLISAITAWDYTKDFRKKFKFIEFSS